MAQIAIVIHDHNHPKLDNLLMVSWLAILTNIPIPFFRPRLWYIDCGVMWLIINTRFFCVFFFFGFPPDF